MNWLKKLFQNKTSEPQAGAADQTTDSTVDFELPDITVTTHGKYYVAGIDHDFINLMYFKDEVDKSTFIKKIEEVLSKLKIDNQMDYVTAHKKLAVYNFNADENFIPFLTDSLLVKSIHYSKIEYDGKIRTTETPREPDEIGKEKINSYYLGLNFCSANLLRKIENNFFDFQFEENHINYILQDCDVFNYVRIETLFTLGQAYQKAGLYAKMNNTFDKIRSEVYDLQPSTISKFYRSIGEIYVELKQKEQALDWLKAGLSINPKLGVKKLISSLEKP
jgi:tetratricopeptide (TPR) repeat protein